MKVDSLEVVIQSDASRANAELDKMIAKLNQVSRTLVSTSSTRLGGGNMRGMSSGLSSFIGLSGRARKSTISLAAAFGKFYASCFLVIRGIKSLGKAIGSTMDYIETYNYYNVIMDKIGTEFADAWKENGYASADAYAKSFKERLNTVTQKMTGYKIGDEGGLYSTDQLGLGLDPEKILNYQASIASITNAVGLVGETSINTAKAMSMLAADMSSLKNVDLETVMTNLQSGLIGQSRALYKYGIDITNATLQTYALKYGIEKEVSEMTQAEKMQLRMLAILDQSKVAYGDMANTINGVANQYRVLKQQVANLARTIGAMFIPVLQAVLPYINGFVIALRRMFEWLGMAVYGANSWSKLMDGISSGYTDTGLDSLGDEAEDTTDALKDADKAANKLKRTIHGYDELHIATDNSGKDDAKLGSIDLSDEIGNALGAYESIWDNALKGMDNKAQAIADKIAGFFQKIWKSIEPFRNAVKDLFENGLSKFANFKFDSLKSFYENFLKPIGEWAFGTTNKGFTEFINTINAFLSDVDYDKIISSLDKFWKALEPIIEYTGDGANWLLKYVIKPLANFQTNYVFPAFLETIADRLETVKQYIDLLKTPLDWILDKFEKVSGFSLPNDFLDKFAKSFANASINLFPGIGGINESLKAIQFLMDAVGNVKGSVSALSNSFDILFSNIQTVFSGASAIVQTWFDTSVAPWFTAEKWNTLYDTMKTTLMTKWTEIVVWWQTSTLVTWFENDVKPWFTVEKWLELYTTVKDSLVTKWEEFTTWWSENGVSKWFNETVKPIFDSKNWTFSGIKDGLKTAFEIAVDAVKAVWNSFANWLNDKLTFNIPKVKIGDFSVGGSKITLGKLPTFQTGGFPEDGLFMANHNEMVGKFNNGKTAVANNEQITTGIRNAVVDGLMQVLMSSNQNSETDRPIEIHVHVGSDELGVATYKGLKDASIRGLIPKIV